MMTSESTSTMMNNLLWLVMKMLTANVAEDPALCAVFLTVISVILIAVSLPFSLFFCVKVSVHFGLPLLIWSHVPHPLFLILIFSPGITLFFPCPQYGNLSIESDSCNQVVNFVSVLPFIPRCPLVVLSSLVFYGWLFPFHSILPDVHVATASNTDPVSLLDVSSDISFSFSRLFFWY